MDSGGKCWRPGEETDLDEVTGIPRAVLPQVEALENLEDVPATTPEASTPTATQAAAKAEAEPSLNLPSAQFKFDASGNHLVQIAALRSQDAANAAWIGAIGAYPNIYAGAEKRVQRADLGAKGVFYRLRVGAFAERTEASAFCSALKERGETCIVVSG